MISDFLFITASVTYDDGDIRLLRIRLATKDPGSAYVICAVRISPVPASGTGGRPAIVASERRWFVIYDGIVIFLSILKLKGHALLWRPPAHDCIMDPNALSPR